jgi:PKD repeat protein
VIIGMDGGLVVENSVQKIRTEVIDQGKRAIFIGGSCIQEFANGVDQYLVSNLVYDYCWDIPSPPHFTVTDPSHGLAEGLPGTYNFIREYAAYYMLRIDDPEAEIVAVNGHGWGDLFYKGFADGDLIWLLNSPKDPYWEFQQDFDLLKQVVENALSYQAFVDIPWLEVDPVGGNVDADSWFEVELTFTASPDLEVGETYTGILRVQSSDPVNSGLDIPLSMTVVEPVWSVSVSPDMEGSYMPGHEFTYPVEVTNTGNMTDTYLLTLSESAWLSELDEDSLTLLPGETAEVYVTVHIPEDAGMGEWDMVVLRATSITDEGVFAECQITTTAEGSPAAGFTFSPAIPSVGQTVQFTNETVGAEPITYEWDFGDGETSTARHPTHAYAAAGTYEVILTATNPFGVDTISKIIVVENLPTVPELKLELAVVPEPIILHQPATFTAVVTNEGDVTVEGVVASGGMPDFVIFVAASEECVFEDNMLTCDLGDLEPGETKSAWVTVIFTSTGAFDISMRADAPGAIPATDAIRVIVESRIYIPIILRTP